MTRNISPWQASRLAAITLLNYRFTATAVNDTTLPGVTSRARIDNGSEDAGNIASVSGATVLYRNEANGTGTVLNDGYVEVTAGSQDVQLTAQINTLGTGSHSGTVFWRDINATNNPIGGQTQGTYGQGSTNQPAVIVVPAGQTVTYTVRVSPSANNQVVQVGSYIEAVELP